MITLKHFNRYAYCNQMVAVVQVGKILKTHGHMACLQPRGGAHSPIRPTFTTALVLCIALLSRGSPNAARSLRLASRGCLSSLSSSAYFSSSFESMNGTSRRTAASCRERLDVHGTRAPQERGANADPPAASFSQESLGGVRVVVSLTSCAKQPASSAGDDRFAGRAELPADAIYVNLPKRNARTGEPYPPPLDDGSRSRRQGAGLRTNQLNRDYEPLTKLWAR